MTWNDLLLASIVVAVISMDISRTALFQPMRDRFAGWYWISKLIACPYCLSHWVAVVVVSLLNQYEPNVYSAVCTTADNLFYSFVVVGLATVPMMVIDFLLFVLDQSHA